MVPTFGYHCRSMLGFLGRGFVAWSRESAAMVMLPYAALKGAVLERGRGGRLVVSQAAAQVYFTAVEPLPILLLIAVTCGFFAVVLCDFLMRPNGLAPYVPTVIAYATVREIVPLVIAVILIGRSGTAIATELGYMRVNQEIDALDASGVNVDYFLVLPRLVGVTVSAVALTVAMSAAAILGGFLLGEGLRLVSVGLSLSQITKAIGPEVCALALGKAALFGGVIATVSCFHGLSVGRSFTEIPQANVRGAVQCYLACFALNAVISVYALSRLA
jgi:phospholipid/cholesterol/gamma-HCH transport system permease protein